GTRGYGVEGSGAQASGSIERRVPLDDRTDGHGRSQNKRTSNPRGQHALPPRERKPLGASGRERNAERKERGERMEIGTARRMQREHERLDEKYEDEQLRPRAHVRSSAQPPRRRCGQWADKDDEREDGRDQIRGERAYLRGEDGGPSRQER